jgi:hypothetical protein
MRRRLDAAAVAVVVFLLLSSSSAQPQPTTGTAPCDHWEELLDHNAVWGEVDVACKDPKQKPPCDCGRKAKWYLLGHVDDLKSCETLAESVLPASVTGKTDEVCKVVGYTTAAKETKQYARSCVCGTTMTWIADKHPQKGFASAACQSYSTVGAALQVDQSAIMLLVLFVLTGCCARSTHQDLRACLHASALSHATAL